MFREVNKERPSVREVLRALELLGIITTVGGGANYISEDIEHCLIGPLSILFRLNNSSVQQAQQFRAALEEAAAGLAAESCMQEHMRTVENYILEMMNLS